jgi:hypothetical protein
MEHEKPVLHVRPWGRRGWTVVREDVSEPLSVYPSQSEAVSHAGMVARLERTALVVHRREGAIGYGSA